MLKRTLGISASIFMILSFASCGDESLESRPSSRSEAAEGPAKDPEPIAFTREDSPTCGTVLARFSDQIWPGILQPKCLACHAVVPSKEEGQDQLSKDSFDLYADAKIGEIKDGLDLIHNLATLSKFLSSFEGDEKLSILERKAIGEGGHEGGEILAKDSPELQALAQYREDLKNLKSCSLIKSETDRGSEDSESEKPGDATPPPPSPSPTPPAVVVDLGEACVQKALTAQNGSSRADLEAASNFLSDNCASCHATGRGALTLDGQDADLGYLKKLLGYALSPEAKAEDGSLKHIRKPIGELTHGGGAVVSADAESYISYGETLNSLSALCESRPAE